MRCPVWVRPGSHWKRAASRITQPKTARELLRVGRGPYLMKRSMKPSLKPAAKNMDNEPSKCAMVMKVAAETAGAMTPGEAATSDRSHDRRLLDRPQLRVLVAAVGLTRWL